MIRRKSNRASKRFIEPLERRALLAGNVLAAVTAGNLVITGDASDNNIEVQQLAGGTWQVSGLSTNINGGAAVFTTPGPVANVTVDLGAGNDTANIHNGSVTGALSVTGGTENGSSMNVISRFFPGN